MRKPSLAHVRSRMPSPPRSPKTRSAAPTGFPNRNRKTGVKDPIPLVGADDHPIANDGDPAQILPMEDVPLEFDAAQLLELAAPCRRVRRRHGQPGCENRPQ